MKCSTLFLGGDRAIHLLTVLPRQHQIGALQLVVAGKRLRLSVLVDGPGERAIGPQSKIDCDSGRRARSPCPDKSLVGMRCGVLCRARCLRNWTRPGRGCGACRALAQGPV